MIRTHPYLYTVRYRRQGWKQIQQRQYIIKAHALDLVDKLRQPPSAGLAPLVELTVHRRQLGPAEQIWQLDFENTR